MLAILVVAGAIGLVMFVVIAVVLPCQWIAKQAKEDARKEYEVIISGIERNPQFSSRAILYVKNESKTFDIYSGHLIKTSSTHVALYAKKSEMMIFPLANVSKMEIPENKIDAKQ